MEAEKKKLEEEADAKRQPREIRRKQIVSYEIFKMLKRLVEEPVARKKKYYYERRQELDNYGEESDQDQDSDREENVDHSLTKDVTETSNLDSVEEEKKKKNESTDAKEIEPETKVEPETKAEKSVQGHQETNQESSTTPVSVVVSDSTEAASKAFDSTTETKTKVDEKEKEKKKQKALDVADFKKDYTGSFSNNVRADFLLVHMLMEKDKIEDSFENTVNFLNLVRVYFLRREVIEAKTPIEIRREACNMLRGLVHIGTSLYSRNKWWENVKATRVGKMTLDEDYDSDDYWDIDSYSSYERRKPPVLTSSDDIQKDNRVDVKSVEVDQSELFVLNTNSTITSPIFPEMKQVVINGFTFNVTRRSIAQGTWTFDLEGGGQLQTRKNSVTHWVPLSAIATDTFIWTNNFEKDAEEQVAQQSRDILSNVLATLQSPPLFLQQTVSLYTSLPWKHVHHSFPYNGVPWAELSKLIDQFKDAWFKAEESNSTKRRDYEYRDDNFTLFDCWQMENKWALKIVQQVASRTLIWAKLLENVKKNFVRTKGILAIAVAEPIATPSATIVSEKKSLDPMFSSQVTDRFKVTPFKKPAQYTPNKTSVPRQFGKGKNIINSPIVPVEKPVEKSVEKKKQQKQQQVKPSVIKQVNAFDALSIDDDD